MKDFDKEIENDNFIGSPTIQIIKLIEENNIVIAEGAVQGNMKNGNKLDAVFCDVFEMENGKIKKLVKLNIDSCIECGACEYACPSRVPLISSIKNGKMRSQ